ncbi:alpha-tocopherol transfer protein-like [Glandiceps talaboti]
MSSNESSSSLSPELLKKARDELNEDPDTRQQKLDDLREMFKRRPDIKFRNDDAFLLRYLRVRKFNVEKAYKTLVHYYEVRHQYKDIFTDFTPSAVTQQLEDQIHTILPERDSKGRRILILKPGNWNPGAYSLTPVLKAGLMYIELMSEEEETQINGIVFIGDFGGMTKEHLKHFNPMLGRKLADTLQNALPIRLKEVHYINQPKFFDLIFSIFRPFLSEKLVKRLHFHGDEYGNLHQHIGSAILPTEYGGALQNVTNREWIAKLKSKENEIIENNKYGFPKSADTLGGQKQGSDPAGGLVGSFKKLDV